MNFTKKTAAIGVSLLLCTTALFGCGSQKKDLEAATEAANSFMSTLKDEKIEEISTYATEDVATGAFVELFDAAFLKQQLLTSLGSSDLEDATVEKIDSFFAHYASMIEDYSITEVTLNEDNTATAYVTMDNSFPFDIVTSEATQQRFAEASEQYNTEHEEELSTIAENEGTDAAVAKACNDMILLAVDIYEESIERSQPITYMIALTLSKDEESGTYLVTSVQSYDSSVAGTGEPATETDTTTTEAASSSDPTDSLFEEISDN